MATNNVINTNGVIPAFLAFPTANASNITGDSTVYNCLFPNEKFDISNDYSTVTGIFTASIEGDYFFYGNIATINTLGLSNFEMYLSTTAATYMLLSFNANNMAYPASDYIVANGNSTVHLQVGQTAQLQLKVSGGAKIVDIVKADVVNLISFFGGYLVTPH